MSGRLSILCFLALLVMSVRAARAQETAAGPRLPQDTLWAIIIPNASELRGQWNASRFAEAFQSEEAAKLRAAFQSEWQEMKDDFKEDSNVDFDTVTGLFDGYVAVFSTQIIEGGEEPKLDFVFLAEVPAAKQELVRETLEQLIAADASGDAKAETEEFEGATIHKISIMIEAPSAASQVQGLELEAQETKQLAYAFTGDVLLFAEGANQPVKKMIRFLKDKEQASLDQNSDYKKLIGEFDGAGEAILWVNMPKLLSFAQQSADPQALQFMDIFGLASIGSIAATLDFTSDGLLAHAGALMPREKKGFVELLYAGKTNSLETASFVPADAYRYTSYTLDFGSLWKGVRQIAMQLNPQADMMITAWTSTVQQNYGIDIENELIANLQGEHATYYRPGTKSETASEDTPPAPSMLTLIGLTNGQKTIDALDALFTKLSGEPFHMPIKSVATDDGKIWTTSEDSPLPANMEYAVGLTPNYLVVGTGVADVQQAVNRIVNERGDSLALSPDFKAAAEANRKENLRLFTYSGPGAYDQIVDQFRYILSRFNSGSRASADFDLAPEDVPPAEWWRQYFGSCVQTVQLTSGVVKMDIELNTVGN